MRGRSRLERYLRLQAGLHGPLRYRESDHSAANYWTISTDPPVFHVAHWLDERLRLNSSREELHRYLRSERAYFLYSWCWWIEEPERVRHVRVREDRHRRRYPGHRFVHLCNTPRQQDLFAAAGLEAVLCNHNALVDEKTFRPLPEVRKRFDALYDAQLTPYKRHHLAAEVRSLALIHATSIVYDDPAHARQTLHTLAHAHLCNHDPEHGYRKLDAGQVNHCLNECRVGLCLSEVEGAMYASIQYLLAGLPVVSTESHGGRDVFFDQETALIVAPDPEAVRTGVDEMIRCNLQPEQIRARTLEKIAPHRQTFIAPPHPTPHRHDRPARGRLGGSSI